MVLDESLGGRIESFLRSVREVDVSEDLVRNEDLGSLLNFSDCAPAFEEFQRFAADLSSLSWSKLPKETQDSVWESLLEVRQAFWDIREFSSEEQGKSERDELANSFLTGFDKVKVKVAPFLAYLFWESGDLKDRANDLDRVITEARTTVEASLRDISDKSSAADRTLEAMRDAAGETGVTQEAKTFVKAARRYELRSLIWILMSAFLLAGTLGVAYLLVEVWETEGELKDAAVLQIVLAKAAALAVLSYATITAVRLYRSNAHLAAVNRHRADALLTFKTFLAGTESSEIKDKVLLVAANAAFGQTPTGLIGDKGDGANTLEVLDGIGGGLIRRP